jgi:uncharacterized protein YodC (DUF2158 family)
MAQQFQAGDTVQLKSGGPVMTVVEYGKYSVVEGYKCRWFDDKNNLKEDVFTEAESKAFTKGPAVRFGSVRGV